MNMENKTTDPLASERDLTGKKIVRRRDVGKVIPAEALEPRNIKVDVSIKLDSDILEYFKEQARKPGALPYQIQINQALREAMGRAGEEFPGEALTKDERFVAAIAERIRQSL
jgi:uncharacterized protein (DUF4415 family)